MSRLNILQQGEDVLIRIKAVPGSSRDQVAGVLGDRLKVKTSAPPEGGKANKAICALIAEKLLVRKSDVSIEVGHGSAEKVIRVRGLTTDEAIGLLIQ